MQIYLAAVYTNGYRAGGNSGRYQNLTDHEKIKVNSVEHLLESYAYVEKQRFVDAMREDHVKVFLDSGAFSAYTLGIELSVEKYCEYIKRNIDLVRVEDGILMASVLDGIGDPLQTYRNQLEMEDRGIRALPCFHAGEDERYLEYYIQNYEYITLGGMVGVSSTQTMKWLDRVWDRYLVDGSGRAKLKVHGFGITSVPIMESYPWYSCDSSSWVQNAAFGAVNTPQWGAVYCSEKSPLRHYPNQHATTLSQIEQDAIFEHLEKYGFSYERLSKVYEARAAYNLWAFGLIQVMINSAHGDGIFRGRVRELF
jgi:hypothetical protein